MIEQTNQQLDKEIYYYEIDCHIFENKSSALLSNAKKLYNRKERRERDTQYKKLKKSLINLKKLFYKSPVVIEISFVLIIKNENKKECKNLLFLLLRIGYLIERNKY